MSFAKAGSQTLFFRILLLSISALTTIIQARFLGPEGMGILVLLVTIKRLAFSFGNLGFGSSFAFFIAQNRTTRDEALKVAWLVGTLLSVIAIMAFIVIRPLSFHRGTTLLHIFLLKHAFCSSHFLYQLSSTNIEW